MFRSGADTPEGLPVRLVLRAAEENGDGSAKKRDEPQNPTWWDFDSITRISGIGRNARLRSLRA
eukprot:1337975-Amorphochlora_amoeboformis.AAC.1